MMRLKDVKTINQLPQTHKSDLPEVSFKTKGPKYIPLSRRGDKPNAIAWIVKYHPELKDSQIVD